MKQKQHHRRVTVSCDVPTGRDCHTHAVGAKSIKGLETSQTEGLALEASFFGLYAGTEDKQEGTRAFLEKRAPQFQGR